MNLTYVAAIGGIALIAGAIVYAFKTSTFPTTMLGLALMGAFLVALPYTPHFGFKNGEFTMELAQQNSVVQGNITEINQKLDVLLQRGGPVPPNAITPRKNYSVLIFFSDARAKLANDVKTWLLNAGYNASATATDFSELGTSVGNPNTARFIYSEATSSAAPNLPEELTGKFSELDKMQLKPVPKLTHGDAQLMLF